MPKILLNKSNIDLDYPICRPSLDLDFTQEELDPRITFSRGSIGTRVNRNRLIETVAVNQPRFDYGPVTGECKGLLIEESRQNLFTYSEDFTNSVWAKNNSSISSNVITAPDGTLTADKLIGNSGVRFRQSTYYRFVSVTSGTTYTFSVFLKAAERRYISMWFDNLNVSQGAYYGASDYIDLQTGTNLTGSAVKIIPYPNGWYRCYVTATPTVTLSTFIFQIAIGTPNNYHYDDIGASNTYKYTGDGTSGIYVWGAQVEAGSFPTSYIPTTASTVTRSADLARMTGTNFSSWYNQTEGTFYIASRITASPVSPGVRGLEVSDGTTNNRFEIGYWFNVGSGIYIFTTFSGIVQYQTYPTITLPATTKQIATYSTLSSSLSYTTSISSSVNGFNTFRKPDYNVLGIGKASSTNANYLNGTISRLTYYPRALKPNQLQSLTS